LILLIAPFAPHLAEEIWEELWNEYSIFTTGKWPSFDSTKLVSDMAKIAVQINGKVRWAFELSPETTEEEIMKLIKADPKLSAWLTSEPKKVIYVKWKIVNIVI
jgi:leucyl-tRNA synthetase